MKIRQTEIRNAAAEGQSVPFLLPPIISGLSGPRDYPVFMSQPWFCLSHQAPHEAWLEITVRHVIRSTDYEHETQLMGTDIAKLLSRL